MRYFRSSRLARSLRQSSARAGHSGPRLRPSMHVTVLPGPQLHPAEHRQSAGLSRPDGLLRAVHGVVIGDRQNLNSGRQGLGGQLGRGILPV